MDGPSSSDNSNGRAAWTAPELERAPITAITEQFNVNGDPFGRNPTPGIEWGS